MTVDRRLLQQTAEALFENAPCGYVATLDDGEVVHVNQTFLTMTGLDRGWLVGGRRFCDLLSVGGRVYHDTHFDPLLRLQGSIREVAFEILRADGHRLPVLVNAVRRNSPAEGPTLTLLTVFDATDRRQYERELLEARRRAEKAVDAERVARRLAEDVSRVKDEFLATVSHELRTPLNAILGWTQILETEVGLSDDVREGLGVIARNARAQSELISDLLDASRIVAGKMRLDVRPVSLEDVMDAAVETVRLAADAKGVKLTSWVDAPAVVAGDAGRLQQVLWNLLINAIKFTPAGGSVRIAVGQHESRARVDVTDTGQGMEASFIGHAFDRFRQSDGDHAQKSNGLGLGLSIVRNLVEMHGGTITAASEGSGRGSTFTVSLPLVADREPVSADRPGPGAAVAGVLTGSRGDALRGARLMVVDDEAESRDLLHRIVTTAGADVVTAASAAEALDLLIRQAPDVLLSDVDMPGEDGHSLIRKVRMIGGRTGTVPAIALTGFTGPEDRARALLSGFQVHLCKPVQASELIEAVASLIRK